MMSGHSGAGSSRAAGPSCSEGHTFTCTLEELYKGSVRNVYFTRTTVNRNGNTTTTEMRLKITVIPGWKQGTKITFQGLGDILEPRKAPGDVVFVVEVLPHETFTREGHDLIMRKNISLVDALTGCSFFVTTLDGRWLSVEYPSVITPDFEMVIPGEGMPVPDSQPVRRGKLRIKFDVHFPVRLSDQQKIGLWLLLQGCSSSSSG